MTPPLPAERIAQAERILEDDRRDVITRLTDIGKGQMEHDERLDRIEGMLDEVTARLGDVLKFAALVEAQWSAFRSKGVFGMIGGFNKR